MTTWRKVHWPNDEYPWGVLEGPETPQHRDETFGPFMDERIVAHCFHEADADQIIADHDAATELADARKVLRHICDDVDLEWRDYKAKYGDDHDKFPEVQDIAREFFAKYPDPDAGDNHGSVH